MGEECGVTHQLRKQNHRLTGGSTVLTINIEIHATGAVSPEIPTSVFVISLHNVSENLFSGQSTECGDEHRILDVLPDKLKPLKLRRTEMSRNTSIPRTRAQFAS